MRIHLLQAMSPDDAAKMICEGSDTTSGLYRFVIAVDENAADWALTERLFEYFQGEMQVLAAEKAKDGESLS